MIFIFSQQRAKKLWARVRRWSQSPRNEGRHARERADRPDVRLRPVRSNIRSARTEPREAREQALQANPRARERLIIDRRRRTAAPGKSGNRVASRHTACTLGALVASAERVVGARSQYGHRTSAVFTSLPTYLVSRLDTGIHLFFSFACVHSH